MEFNVLEPEYTKKSKVSTTNTTNQSLGIINWFKHHFKSKVDNSLRISPAHWWNKHLEKEQMHDPDPVLIEISTDGGMNQHAKSPTEKVSRSEAMSDSDTSTVDVRDIESNIQFYDQTIQVYGMMNEIIWCCRYDDQADGWAGKPSSSPLTFLAHPLLPSHGYHPQWTRASISE